jgi:hypothetical protein
MHINLRLVFIVGILSAACSSSDEAIETPDAGNRPDAARGSGSGSGSGSGTGSGSGSGGTDPGGISPISLWNLTVVRAEIPFDCGDGIYDGILNGPDPYLELKLIASETKYTSVKEDNFKPMWNELMGMVLASQLLDQPMVVNAYDDDGTTDQRITSCILQWTANGLTSGGDLHVACPRDCAMGNAGMDLWLRAEPY